MPNFSGIWNATEQFQARGQNIWPAPPGAPTIGTATAGSSVCASVTFTAPGCTGRYPAGITNYTAISTPGCITASGASSPVTVTGLVDGTSYTFRVRANGASGLNSPLSAASNSITASNAGSQSYTTAGSYSWVAPAGVTSVSVVVVGGGSKGGNNGGGGGGALGYGNNLSVTPGTSYTVVVGAGGAGPTEYIPGGDSYFVNTGYLYARGGKGGDVGCNAASSGSAKAGGGSGGRSLNGGKNSGGGAGGYSGNGGNSVAALNGASGAVVNGNAGAGGGGASGSSGGAEYYICCGVSYTEVSGGGGGVGIFGQGSNGVPGGTSRPPKGGGGGSGGTNGGASFLTGINTENGGPGGAYGGGGGGGYGTAGAGAVGAVRIVWPGNTRTFPSTNVGAP